MQIPEKFVNTVISTWGDTGAHWLKELPSLISYCKEKWQLTHLDPHDNLSYNYILFVNRINDPTKMILKLCPPNPDFKHKIRTLSHYNGHGAVKLLDYDLEKGALLMEAILPGTSLKSYFPKKDLDAVSIVVKIMNQLHSRKLPTNKTGIPTIEQWLKHLDFHTHNLPEPLIKKAKELSAHLLKTTNATVLLHGDLHHDNILLHHKEWTSIDPKGVVGEPAYEVGAFIRNPMPELLVQKNPSEIIQQRLDQFSTLLCVEKLRLCQWCFVQAVLSACFAYEDNVNWRQWIECAELIQSGSSYFFLSEL